MYNIISLESLCKEIIDCPHSTPKWQNEGIPVIRNYNLKDGKIDCTNLSFVSEEDYNERVKRAIPEESDIIISREAPMGVVGIIPEGFQCCLGQRLVLLKIDKSKCIPTYLLYSLMSEYVQLQIRRINRTGSIVSNLNISSLKELKILLHNFEEQSKIATILSSIDDKISLNNQINQELEAMAKTLYDYWFVQFDFPDKNGKPYKSSGGKMVYNPELKREIPEGWGVAKVEDIAQTGSGGTPKSTNVSYYSNGEIPWINSGELEQTVITSTSNFITEEGLNNSSAKLFPSGTILVAMYGATAGKVSFLTFEASTNQAICAIMLTDIRMRYYLKNVIEDLYQYLVKLSTGSARDNLSQDMIKNIKVVIPSNDILDRFYDFSNNIIKEITKKQQENEQLTQLRDWFLPMLMNGQVKVE